MVIRQRISQRYGIAFPLESLFWDCVEQHPELPIVVTEGGKKGLAGLSQGFITIPLYGCYGGYTTKDALGHPRSPTLIPDLARFAVPGRASFWRLMRMPAPRPVSVWRLPSGG
jgi:hypothetical protein